MELLLLLCRYNNWANARMLDACRGVPAAVFEDETAGTVGSAGSTLKHLVHVEDRYLAYLHGQDPDATMEPSEAYNAHDLGWFADRLTAVGKDYLSVLGERDDASLSRPLGFGGSEWDFFTVQDAVLQVLTHSGHHRAQVLSALGAHGIQVPDVDYVIMAMEENKAAASSG